MSTAFVSVPLFRGMDESGLAGLGEVFEAHTIAAGDVLFESGETAEFVYLLIEGRVALQEEGETEIELEPTSLMGELGAMTGLSRRVTAVALESSVLLRAHREGLREFFERNAAVATIFYQNLLGMAADKVRRDERRLDDMRHNLIRTQKALKQLRDLILESPTTTVSQPVHDKLEELIAHNRRANYVIEPPAALPAEIRLPEGAIYPVYSMSVRHVVVPAKAASGDGDWHAVLCVGGMELAIGGAVSLENDGNCRVDLDMLIEEQRVQLESYLTQAQLLDIVL